MGEPASKRAWRRGGGGLLVAVRVTPKSSRDAVDGLECRGDETAIKARVRAVPEKGKANLALEKLLARWLDVPRSRVGVVAGTASRMKTVEISGNPDELATLVDARLQEGT